MKRRAVTKEKPAFLTEIAKLGLRGALRPYLHPTNPSFVAALVLPPTAMPHTYAAAAEELFDAVVNDVEFTDTFNVKVIDNAGGDDVERGFRSANILRRTLFLLTATCDLPTEFALSVDHYGTMPPPKPEHVAVAARSMGVGELSRADAALLAESPFSRIAAAMTAGRPFMNAIRRLRCAPEEPICAERRPTTHPDGTRLANLIGFEEVKEWGRMLAQDIAGWREGTIPWDQVDRGAVVVGPPGTGKTVLASALAAACGMHFLPTSSAKWQSKGHLGDFLKAMMAAFKEASDNAPCLMFLDELDSVGDRDGDRSDNRQYTRQAVNGLLECLDGSHRRPGVVVIGATNNIGVIDPAVLRSGRLERVFNIGLPSADERLSILAVHLRPHQLELPRERFRMVSAGMSGADLERIARTAKRKARAERRTVVVEDVMSALPAIRPYNEAELRRLAVHEAGHALVGLRFLPDSLLSVSIDEFQVVGGRRNSIGATVFAASEKIQRTVSDYLDEVAMLLGGIAAEDLVLGAWSDGVGGVIGSDLVTVTDLVTRMECQMAMGETLISEVVNDAFHLQQIRMRRPEIVCRVDEVIKAEFKRAEETIWNDKFALDDLVDALIARKSLSGAEAKAIVENAPIRRRQAISAARRRK